MASQIAHIVYAQKFFEKLESGEGGLNLEGISGDFKKYDFFLGCAFPDIRRIDKNISRKDMHLCFEKVDFNFSGLSSFEAGWKFHLYCDMKREEILNKAKFYSLKNASDHYNLPAKILEDEIVYDCCGQWDKIGFYFNNAPEFGISEKISSETFHLWYAILAKYMEKKPDDKSMRIFLSKLSGLSGQVDEIIDAINKLRLDAGAVKILGRIKDEIV